jgi:hypothetical protein
MNGKGSKPRPLSVSRNDFAARWDLVFKKGETHVLQQEKRLQGKETLNVIQQQDGRVQAFLGTAP